MLMFSLFRALAFVAAHLPWMLNLATRVAARLLNMPEPMLHHAGAYGIQFNIPATHHQVLVATDGRTLIPSFSQRAGALIGIVDIADVPSPHTLHKVA